MVVVMAVGGSTNAVLHLIAMARAVDVPLTIDDFQQVSDRVPYLADLRPSGKYVQEDLHAVGGTPAVMKLLLENGLLDRRLPDDHRQDDRRKPGGAARAHQGAGRRPADFQSDQGDRPHPHHARQLLPRRRGGQDHRQGRAQVHRHRQLLRLGRGHARRDAEAEDQEGRRRGDSLRRTARRTGHAGNALSQPARSSAPAWRKTSR